MTAIMGAAANPGQLVENMPSSLVGMASMFGKTPAKELKPKYGVQFRFTVTLDETSVRDLGKWSSCKGLKMRFEPTAVRSGGIYTTQQYLPGELLYEKITLSRAVEASSSKAVQGWLQQAAVDWINGSDKKLPGGAQISLLDSAGKEVLTWFLQGVRPVAWTGPDLDANAGKVAIETLELVHEGFVIVTGPDPIEKQPAVETPSVVSLSVKGSNAAKDKIVFFNAPKEITISRTTEEIAIPLINASDGTVSEGAEDTGKKDIPLTKANVTKLTLADMYLVPTGRSKITDNVEKLIAWMGTGQKSTDPKKPKVVEPAELVLTWGKFTKDVKLTELSGSYVRFTSDGLPIRAKLRLTLSTVPAAAQAGTNPTSGGLPGRRAHELVSDESLPLLAHKSYGNTAHWRDIAEANGIDDPLRARPGDRILLPSPHELPRRGGH